MTLPKSLCPACGNYDMHYQEWEDWILTADDEMRVTNSAWQCQCGHRILDWEDDFEYPEDQ